MNFFQPHIPFHQLIDYAEGRLRPNQQRPVEIHLAACQHCHDQVMELKRLFGLMRRDNGQNAPVTVIQRAVQLFRSRVVPVAAASGNRPRILAVLQFDSMDMAPSFGMRSGKPGSRQILFRAGGNEIDLRIEPSDQAWIVSGQVFGEADSNDGVVLQGETNTSRAALNRSKEFVLPPVPMGVYKLLLNLPHMDVEIDDLRIGS